MKRGKAGSRLGRTLLLAALAASLGLNLYLLRGPGRPGGASSPSQKPVPAAAVTRPEGKPFAYFAFLDQIKPVPPGKSGRGARPLPPELIIPPGTYLFHDQGYELRKEGLYRFVYPGRENQQRIVFSRNVEAVLSALAWIATHGNRDNLKTVGENVTKARTAKLFLSCGPLSFLARHILGALGFKARLVEGLALEGQPPYTSSHVFVEVYRAELGRWVVYDLSNNTSFTHQGRPLSLLELAEGLGSGRYELRPLADDIRLDVSGFFTGTFDQAFALERLASRKGLKQYYEQVLGVIFIRDRAGVYYYYDEGHAALVERHVARARYLEREEFVREFYGPQALGREW